MKEQDFESILVKYPEIIEQGLTPIGRQLTLYGRRIDILFEDRFTRKLLVELKVGPIKDEHIGQILSYEGMILSSEDPDVRIMLIGTRVPLNIQRSLDYHGIAWREKSLSHLQQTLSQRNDEEMLNLIKEETGFKSERMRDSIRKRSQARTSGFPEKRLIMKKLFGCRLRGKLLGWLFNHIEEAFFVRQMATVLKEDPGNVSREMSVLEKMGILKSSRHGNLKHYQVSQDCGFFEELRGLVVKLTSMPH